MKKVLSKDYQAYQLQLHTSKINGTGLFVMRDRKKGDFIAYIHGPKITIRNFTTQLSQQGLNWIGASRFTWIITDDSPFRYINHSCNPNVAIKGERTVYALRNIQADEEITMDYSLTEAEDDWCVEKCTCNSTNCRKFIGPVQSLSPQVFAKLKPIITKKFQSVYYTSTAK